MRLEDLYDREIARARLARIRRARAKMYALNVLGLCAIGFGISTPEQARKMADLSDGAIVGSAIIKLLEKYGKDAPAYIGAYVKSMKDALR